MREAKPRECGAMTGAARPPEWPTSPPEWKRRRGGARPSKWPKTPGGGRHGVSGGFELTQGANNPGVSEEPQGDKTKGGPTGDEVVLGEDRRGRGEGDENPPTDRATRTQGADGDDGGPMGGQRRKEPPGTTETVEENGSAGPRPRQSNSANGARSVHGALALREYDLLLLEAAEGGTANAGAASIEDGHGTLEKREGTERE